MRKSEHYKMIETELKMVAVARRMLMEMEGEDKSEIDKFIAEVGGREIERIEQMSQGEFLMEMFNQMFEVKKAINEAEGN